MKKLKNKGLVISLFVASVLIASHANLFAAMRTEHVKMGKCLVLNAINLCPFELRQYLGSQYNVILDGMTFSARRGSKLKSSEVDRMYRRLIQDLKKGVYSDYNTVITFGMLASAVSENIYPGMKCKKSTSIPEFVSYDGFHESGNIKKKILDYKKKYNYSCKDRKFLKKKSDLLYTITINEILDVWVSAWKESGHRVEKSYKPGSRFPTNLKKNVPEIERIVIGDNSCKFCCPENKKLMYVNGAAACEGGKAISESCLKDGCDKSKLPELKCTCNGVETYITEADCPCPSATIEYSIRGREAARKAPEDSDKIEWSDRDFKDSGDDLLDMLWDLIEEYIEEGEE